MSELVGASIKYGIRAEVLGSSLGFHKKKDALAFFYVHGRPH
jgi:hypothetical protein